MRNIYIVQEKARESLIDYPCVNPNGKFLEGKKISLFGNNLSSIQSVYESLGGHTFLNPDYSEMSFSNVGVIRCKKNSCDNPDAYYDILEYFIKTMQKLIHKMKYVQGFKHIIVILPKGSDKPGAEYYKMAYYSIYGMVKGLAKEYAQYGLFVNGIIENQNMSGEIMRNYLELLASDNSCNIVGQIFL